MRSNSFPALLAIFILVIGISAQTEPTKEPAVSGLGVQRNDAVIEAPQAVYPRSGRKDNISGGVTVKVTIDESGNVISATVVKGLKHPEFRESAIAAAKKARFHPLIREGKPVKVIRTLEYNFILEDDGDFDEKHVPILFGVILEMAKTFAEHPNTLFEGFGGPELFLEFAKEPTYGKAFAGLKDYKNLTPQKRREEAEKTYTQIKNKLKPGEQWQIQMGKHIGSAIGPAVLLTALQKVEEMFVLNPDEAKFHFGKILELSKNPPKDFDAELLQKLRGLGETSNLAKPFSRENHLNTMSKFMAVVDVIMPEKESR